MTFANLPSNIEQAISNLLIRQENADWVKRAIDLHERYTKREKKNQYILDNTDVMAYLAMRVPATFAQIHSAMSAVQEMIPSWQPQSVLDIGSGPGTAVWASKSVWPSIGEATCIDNSVEVLKSGDEIIRLSDFSININWQRQDVRKSESILRTYDLVVVGNVLNELSPAEGEKVIGKAFNSCKGIMLVIEPGTPLGSSIVSSVAKKLGKAGTIVAPFVGGSYVDTGAHWLHFAQRFVRPEFSRRIRQHMRDSSQMASDWEDAKFSYVAISKIPAEKEVWGRVAGPIRMQKGFLEMPILTASGVENIKVMKRDKELYSMAKELRWGETIEGNLFS